MRSGPLISKPAEAQDLESGRGGSDALRPGFRPAANSCHKLLPAAKKLTLLRAFLGGHFLGHPLLQNCKPGWIPVEQKQRAHHGMAYHHISALVFLKGVRTATNQTPGILLSKMQALSDTAHSLGLEQPLDQDLQPVQGSIRNLQDVTGMNALVAGIAIPARHVEGGLVPLIRDGHRTNITEHWLARLRAGGISHRPSP